MSKYRQKAVAVKYNPEKDEAPVVIASGYGSVAERIIDIAEQKGIPVFRDDSAASLLCMLEVGNSIPPELYEVVAAIYCQLLQISSEMKGTEPSPLLSLNDRAKRLGERRSPVTVVSKQSWQTTEKDPDESEREE